MDPRALAEIPARRTALREALTRCTLCPRACGVNRVAGERGACGLTDAVHVFRELLHPAEEAELSPSHQVYFAGCNLSCGFCSVAEWLAPRGAAVDWDALVAAVAARRSQGAVTLNLLGGEPAVSVHGVLDLLARVPAVTRVVFNSNMYYGPAVDAALADLVAVYLADLKCGDPACAARLLGAGDYVSVVRRAIVRAAAQAEVIVRCPVLPGHETCCLEPNLAWLAATLPGLRVSLRCDYVPPAVPGAVPATYVTAAEATRARALVADYGLRSVI